MVRPCVARGFVKLASAVLHQCIRSLIGAVVLRTNMDISAAAISLTDRPQRAIRVTSVRMRREDRSSISSHPLADLGWKLLMGLPHRFLLLLCSSFVREGPFLRPGPSRWLAAGSGVARGLSGSDAYIVCPR